MKATNDQTSAPTEQVGRKYNKTRFGIQSRNSVSGEWYGFPARYKTFEDAEESLAEIGKPILGGLVTFDGGKKDIREYRIVREVAECEVVWVGMRAI